MDQRITGILRLANARRFQYEARESARAVRSIGEAGAISGRTAQAGLGVIGYTLGGLTVAAGSLGIALGTIGTIATGVGLKFDATMEQNRVAMDFFTGSAAAGAKELDFLFKEAARGPFEFPDLVMGARRFLAFGFSVKDTNEILHATHDAIAGLGISGQEGIARVSLALGQIQTKGKVMGQELLQLSEVGIPAYRYLKDELGLTGDEMKRIGNLGIPASVAIKAITDGMRKDFAGQAIQQSKTFNGQLATMKDYASQALGYGVKPLFDYLRKSAFPDINKKIIKMVGKPGDSPIEDWVKGVITGFTGVGEVASATGWKGVELGAKLDDLRDSGVRLWFWIQHQIFPAFVSLFGIIKQASPDLRNLAVLVGFTLYGAFKLLSAALEFTNQNFDIMAPLIYTAIGAWVAYKYAVIAVTLAHKAMAIWGFITTLVALAAEVRTVGGAMIFLNGVMMMNPVLAITTAVIALGTAFYLAYQKVGWFHTAVDDLWDAITSKGDPPGWLKTLLTLGGYDLFKGALELGGKLIPGATGSVISGSNVGLVGENGPELAFHKAGSTVITPLGRQSARKVMPDLQPMNARSYFHFEIPVVLNGREVGRATADEVQESEARRRGR